MSTVADSIDQPDPADRIATVMTRRARTDFLLPEQQASAAEDRPLSIGHGQTNSQPATVAAMLRLLEVRPGDRVLDVGSGSGWTTAILGDLVGSAGEVDGVERVEALVSRSRAALSAQMWEGMPMTWASIHVADPAVLGLPDRAPFGRILVSAEAAEVPVTLIDQLTPDGIMVIPVRGEMLRIIRTGPDRSDHTTTRHGSFRFVPLIEG
nr:protein-L-isoaspartate O-methyltransferase [Brevibacterium yomogidense]